MHSIYQSSTLTVSLLSFVSAAIALSYHAPHCTAGDYCWPSATSWARLNDTLSGRLIRSLPAAAACHDPYYDAAACDAIRTNWTDPNWRSDTPGAYQDTAWENGDEPCYIDGPQNVTCQQGLVPYYTAAVQSVEDIQAAVRFAKDNKLRTRIKGAAHDYLGKSSGKGSFAIQTIRLKGITFDDGFIPSECDVPAEKAVTVAAGEYWYDVYKAADAHNSTIVGGACTSVGAAGGWALGGGHSLLSPQYGLGVDNILQFSVVTADGETKVVNQCQNADLFWAMRGGGGGFAVAASVTYRTHPPLNNITVVLLSISVAPDALTSTLVKYLDLQPALADANLSGYSYVLPPNNISAILFHPNSGENTASANTTLEPLFQYAQEHAGQVEVATLSDTVPSQLALIDTYLSQERQGAASILGSRLFPRSAFESSKVTQKLAEYLSGLSTSNLVAILHLLGGGKVNEPAPDAMGVNPSWRTALEHVLISDAWNSTTSIPDRNKIRENLTKKTQELAQLVPGMGAYANEADVNEPEWQKTFWGDNYERLLEIKSKYDPTGVLTCGKCVGDDIFGS
ncbi:hypothetical protein BOTBODRAFT_38376 [Botryobasidium botryosum FD-172 SS1]|uniref:FAD-binding PCMH-type domain-containing protein n=1 Tax=Botryobasidium botryosum (strain FD-172 SS1) TaxID=930990 RepID=A0A067M7V2_BOTB1|nr:hypothetical protein BOTBODRAFT_38376 [Botryobasidium botryosum FD-172 SS1]